MADSSAEYGTILGPDARFKGEFSFDSSAKVLGRVEGSITSKGKLLIAAGATCKANVTANEVAIEGFIEGNVEATERVEIKAKGRINGDIIASRMTMGDGATIDGHVRIGIDAKSDGKATSTTEPKMSAQPQTAKVK